MNKTFYEWEDVRQRGNIPVSRDFSLVSYKKTFFLFGGQNSQTNFFEFSLRSNTWKPVITYNSPSARSAHSACIYRDMMIIFGGIDKKVMNDVWCYSFSKNEWTSFQTTNPPHRFGHTACIYKDCMYIFGGGSRIKFNDVWLFDILRREWKHVACKGQLPRTRAYHTCCVYKNEMFIFGGFHDVKSKYLNDMFSLNLDSYIWYPITCTGDIPKPRDAHSMVPFNDAFILFGGFNMSDENIYKNDLYVFNNLTRKWKRVDYRGTVTSRSGHKCVIVNDYMYLFGGSSFESLAMTDMKRLSLPPSFYKISNEMLKILKMEKFSDVKF